MNTPSIAASLFGLAMALAPGAALHAAELKVLAGGSLAGPLNALAPQFEAVHGLRLALTFATPAVALKPTGTAGTGGNALAEACIELALSAAASTAETT